MWASLCGYPSSFLGVLFSDGINGQRSACILHALVPPSRPPSLSSSLFSLSALELTVRQGGTFLLVVLIIVLIGQQLCIREWCCPAGRRRGLFLRARRSKS